MTLMELTALLTLDSSGFNKGLAGASALAKSFTVKALDGLGKLSKSLVKTGFEYNREIETMQTSFKTMTGSADKAEQIMKRLNTMAIDTPLQADDLAKTTQLLMQYGISADEAIDQMKRLGDVSLGDANKMNSLALAYGQMHSANRVNMQDIRQMINAGFNPLQEIADRTGESMDSLQKRMQNGTLTVDEITASFQYATSEGGMFFNALADQAKTMNGQLSTLEGKWRNLTGGLVAPFTDQLQTKVLPKLNESIDEVAKALLGVDDAALDLPDVSGQLSQWMDDLLAEWTNGVKEDSATVDNYVNMFKDNTKPIRDAIMERIEVLSGSDDAESQTKIDNARGMLRTLDEIYKEIDRILTSAAGRNLTPEEQSRLESLKTQAEGLTSALNSLSPDAATAWNTFAEAMGNFAVSALEDMTKFIEYANEHLPEIEEAIHNITHPFEGAQKLADSIGGYSKISGPANPEALGGKPMSEMLTDAEAPAQSLVEKIKELQTEAENAGASAGEIANAMEAAGGVNEKFAEMLQFLIGVYENGDLAAESVSAVNDADAAITGAGVESVGTAADVSSTKVGGLVGAVEKLFGYDGKSVNIGVNYSTSGSTGLPGRAVGIDYVPYNGYTAALHEGEMVLTRLEAERFRKNEERGLNNTSGNTEVNRDLNINLTLDIDGKRFAKASGRYNEAEFAKSNHSKALGYGK